MVGYQYGIGVHNQFAQVQTGARVNIKKFVSDYMFRADANEPLVLNHGQQQSYLSLVTRLNAPEDQNANAILNDRLAYDGIGFDMESLSLSRGKQRALADEAQLMYEHGHTINQTVVSFDSQYLKDHGVLDSRVKLPSRYGSLRGHVDQRRLRGAVQFGLKRYFKARRQQDPQFAAAIQVDASAVHVHITSWDKSKAGVNAKGFMTERNKLMLKQGIVAGLQQQPQFVNEVNNLVSVARSTQRNARFKRAILKQELVNSAHHLDAMTLHRYVNGLGEYNQVQLPSPTQQQFAEQVQADWQANGRPHRYSLNMTQRRRRMRRQFHAMLRASTLRREINRYQQAQLRGLTSSDAQPVYDLMKAEYQRQLMIVNKYRSYQRPHVNAIYRQHQAALTQQRKAVLKQRQDLLRDFATQPIRSGYVQRLLKKQSVMANLQQQLGQQPLSKSRAYHDLMATEDDDKHLLSPLTVKMVVKSVPKAEQPFVEDQLTKNQQFSPQKLTPAQQLRLAEYNQALNDYEFNAVSFGGMNVKAMHLSVLDHDNRLNLPSDHASIYDRDNERDDLDVVTSDFEQIMDGGPLKDAVQKRIQLNLRRRFRLMAMTHNFLVGTQQSDPQWFVDTQATWQKQNHVLQQSLALEVKPNPPQAVDGYDIAPATVDKLLDKHIQAVDELAR